MGAKMEEAVKKVETQPTPAPEPPLASAPAPTDEKALLPPPPGAAAHVDDSKALAVVEPEKVPETIAKKPSASHDRDVTLANLEKEKSMSFVRAWEDSEKDKAENKAQKKLSTVTAWENAKKAAIEAKLRTMEEKLEKKKAQYAEKMKNQIGMLHKQADEKRATIQAERGQELLKAEETAAKYRATGGVPKKFLGCF
ncbi:putative remorin [Rosa chinensis]|uniref:Putative remorin n=1 Tax=Rosa chinensis TaxID=74649 RepID=A0A2P6SH65_ROSCH|nr:remorin [Rosa chinensis]PRQ57966.1 putative remorin [Rosa chinensis]